MYEKASHSNIRKIMFYLSCIRTFFDSIIFELEIRFFDKLKTFYPPKGAAKAEPGWGPIDFSYVLIIPSCCLGRYFDVQKHELYPPF